MGNQYVDKAPWSEQDIDERRRLVAQWRLQGWSWNDIFEEIPKHFGGRVTSLNVIWVDHKRALEKRVSEQNENLDGIRTQMLDRLDVAMKAIWPRIEGGSIDHIETFLKIETRRAKLLGVDAPIVVDDRRDPLKAVKEMSEEQVLARMRVLAKSLQHRLTEAPSIIDVGKQGGAAEMQGVPLPVSSGVLQGDNVLYPSSEESSLSSVSAGSSSSVSESDHSMSGQ